MRTSNEQRRADRPRSLLLPRWLKHSNVRDRLDHEPVLSPLAGEKVYHMEPEHTDDVITNSAFDSEECAGTIADWVEECNKTHERCTASDASTQTPKRLVEVVQTHDQPKLKLVDTQPHEKVRYYALSHCWGKHKAIKTTKRNLSKLQNEIPWIALSHTFRDAIRLVSKLHTRFGVKHIWIDSLCIVQDSKEDWTAEASKMADIYEGASLVISATGSQDGRYGFLQPRFPNVKMKRDIMRKDAIHSSQSTTDAYTHDLFTRAPETYGGNPAESYVTRDNPLFDRAWTFQERLLSTRCLHLTRTEMIFECKSAVRCECGAFARRRDNWLAESIEKLDFADFVSTTDVPTNEAWQNWWYYVERYSERKRTKMSDALPAISGLARKVAAAHLGQYCAGMWREGLEHNLLWEPARAVAFYHSFNELAGRPHAVPRCRCCTPHPTWSWISIHAGVGVKFRRIYDSKRAYPTVKIARVQDVSCRTVSNDPFGEIKEGSLTIKGYVIRATAIWNKEFKYRVDLQQSRWPEVRDNKISFDQDASVERGLDRLKDNKTVVTCLLIATEKEVHIYRDHGNETLAQFPYISETIPHRAWRRANGLIKDYEYPKRDKEDPSYMYDPVYEYRRHAEDLDVDVYKGLALKPVKGRPGFYRRIGICSVPGESYGPLVEAEDAEQYIETLNII